MRFTDALLGATAIAGLLSLGRDVGHETLIISPAETVTFQRRRLTHLERPGSGSWGSHLVLAPGSRGQSRPWPLKSTRPKGLRDPTKGPCTRSGRMPLCHKASRMPAGGGMFRYETVWP